jgi:hypothetical protein
MAVTVTIQAELPYGKVVNQIAFVVQDERFDLGDLIRGVSEAAQSSAPAWPEYGDDLLLPPGAADGLNGYPLCASCELDWEDLAVLAAQARAERGFFIPLDTRQVECLEDLLDIIAEMRLVFTELVSSFG